MTRLLCVCLSLLLAVALWGCVPQQEISVPETTIPETTAPGTTVPEPTASETTIPETTVPETTVPETTLPEHSDLYIPGISVEDVILWFNEVALDSEFSYGGDATVIQKWMDPITYSIYGNATTEDLQILESFTDWLNTLEGFPGIYPAQEDEPVNLRIHFGDAQMILDELGPDYQNVDGGIRYWYMDNVIYDAIIGYRDDISQYTRNSVILEEIYNGLGLVQDTSLREDSLIWQGFSEPQSLTEVDELLLKLLYHPDILCGMNAGECEAVIRDLYY